MAQKPMNSGSAGDFNATKPRKRTAGAYRKMPRRSRNRPPATAEGRARWPRAPARGHDASGPGRFMAASWTRHTSSARECATTPEYTVEQPAALPDRASSAGATSAASPAAGRHAARARTAISAAPVPLPQEDGKPLGFTTPARTARARCKDYFRWLARAERHPAQPGERAGAAARRTPAAPGRARSSRGRARPAPSPTSRRRSASATAPFWKRSTRPACGASNSSGSKLVRSRPRARHAHGAPGKGKKDRVFPIGERARSGSTNISPSAPATAHRSATTGTLS